MGKMLMKNIKEGTEKGANETPKTKLPLIPPSRLLLLAFLNPSWKLPSSQPNTTSLQPTEFS